METYFREKKQLLKNPFEISILVVSKKRTREIVNNRYHHEKWEEGHDQRLQKLKHDHEQEELLSEFNRIK